MSAQRLRRAPVTVLGRFADASNETLLVRLGQLGQPPPAVVPVMALDDLAPGELAVYKPRDGERPLADFPTGTLHQREVAASMLSCALGWHQIPDTVLRADAPHGPGSLQAFVPHDAAEHFGTLWAREDPAIRVQLERMIVFDVLAQNADRKAGHVLFDPGAGSARVWLVDHGLCFHHEPKLRTVAWDLAGTPVREELLADVARLPALLAGSLGTRLTPLLTNEERTALRARVTELLTQRTYPYPSVPYPYPWPLL